MTLQKSKSQVIDEKAQGILKSSLSAEYVTITEINGNYPGIDGLIQLVENGDYTGMNLFYQLKGSETFDKEYKFQCEVRYLKYWLKMNLPVILIFVDVVSKNIYWQKIDKEYVNSLKIRGRQKTKIISINPDNVIEQSKLNYIKHWSDFSKRLEPETSFEEFKSIISDVDSELYKLVGTLFLLGIVQTNDSKLLSFIQDLFDFSNKKLLILLYESVKKNYFQEVGGILFLKSKKEGKEALNKIIENDANIFEKFMNIIIKKNSKIKANILSGIATNDNKNTTDFLERVFDKEFSEKMIIDDNFYEKLIILMNYIHRIPHKLFSLQTKIFSIKNNDFLSTSIQEKYIELIGKIVYTEPKKCFNSLCSIVLNNNGKIKTKALKILSDLSGYDYYIFQHLERFRSKGVSIFQFQFIVLEEIKKWSFEEQQENKEIIFTVIQELLSPSFEGTRMTESDKFTITRGAIPACEAIVEIRKKCLEILRQIFSETKDITNKKKILEIIQIATNTPDYPSEKEIERESLRKMIQTDIENILIWYEEIIPNLELSLVKYLDEQIFYYSQRFPELDISTIEKIIAKNKDYEFYNTLVGWDKIRRRELGWREAEALRNKEIEKYLNSIKKPLDKEWEDKIISIANEQNETNQFEFRVFENFLFDIGKTKSNFAKELLKQDKQLKNFIIPLLAGLWQNEEHQNDVWIKLEEYLQEKNSLEKCVRFLAYQKELQIPFIEKLFQALNKEKNLFLLGQMAGYLLNHKDKKLKLIFLQIIKAFSQNENSDWVRHFFLRDDEENLLKFFISKKDFQILLDNLVFAPSIQHNEEDVLYMIAEKFPLEVVEFFRKRIERRMTDSNDIFSGKYYDAIPMHFYKLGGLLQKSTKNILPIFVEWLNKKNPKNYLYPWEIRQLLSAIFRGYTEELEKFFIEYALVSEEQAKQVITILKEFGTSNAVHKTCEEIIKKYKIKKDSEMYSDMLIALSATGVVSGEYGFVEAYKRKKQEIKESFGKNKSPQIKTFLKNYSEYLDKNIEYEKKQADENIALRQREFEN